MAPAAQDLAVLGSDTLHATTRSSSSAAMAAMATAKPEIIFNVLPPAAGKSFMVLLIVMCLCLGAVTVELFNHIGFDIRLIRKPGWTQPTKLISRLAYLSCRYLSVITLALVVLFLSLKFQNCKAMPETFNILGMILLDSVSLVFVQRTMALYGWKPKIVIPLTFYYCVLLAAAAVCIPFYGVGYRIPGTEFCGYDTRRHLTRTLVANIVYKSLGMGLDIIMLLLTLHRLLDGGLKAIWSKKPHQLYSGLSDTSLSSFLIRQGFHFYILQLGTDIFFVSTYFSLNQPSYQVLGTALVFCIPPIAAAAAFREMGKKASMITARNTSKVNEIMNSTASPFGDNSATRAGRGAHLSAGGFSNGVAAQTASFPNGAVNSYVLQARTGGHDNTVATPEKTTRISWGGRRHHLATHSRHEPSADLQDNGILVTVGTVSRTEQVDPQWDGGSPRYSSDIPDPETLQMQRQWPRLAYTPHSDHALNSSDGHSSTEKVDPDGVAFDPVQVPTLATRPTDGNHLHGFSESASSPWIPQTPESPYPPTLLSPRQFSRHSPNSDTTRSNTISRHPIQSHTHIEEEDDSPWRAL